MSLLPSSEVNRRLRQVRDIPPVEVTSTSSDKHGARQIYLTRRSFGLDSPGDSQSVLLFLNAFGEVLHFNDPSLNKWVFLQPAWLVRTLWRLLDRFQRNRTRNVCHIRNGYPFRPSASDWSEMRPESQTHSNSGERFEGYPWMRLIDFPLPTMTCLIVIFATIHIQ